MAGGGRGSVSGPGETPDWLIRGGWEEAARPGAAGCQWWNSQAGPHGVVLKPSVQD